MSTLAKVFVILNFALAVAFLIFTLTAYSKRVKYYDNWKREETAKVQVIKEKDAVIKTKEESITKLTSDLAEKTAESERHKADAKSVALLLEQEKKEKLAYQNTANVLTDQNKVLLEQVQKMRQELEDTRKVVLALKEQNVRLQLDGDEYKRQLVDAQNELNKVRGELEEVHRNLRNTKEELANAEYMVKEAIKAGYKFMPAGVVPDVRTKVVDVKPAVGHVALGAGSDSGIKEGFIFLIHRGDEYIGKVRVTTVWNDFSGGQIIETKKPIKPGDDALTSRS